MPKVGDYYLYHNIRPPKYTKERFIGVIVNIKKLDNQTRYSIKWTDKSTSLETIASLRAMTRIGKLARILYG